MKDLMIYLAGLVCGMILMGVALGSNYALPSNSYKVYVDGRVVESTDNHSIARMYYDERVREARETHKFGRTVSLVEETCSSDLLTEETIR